MKPIIHPLALLIANAGVFAALTVASAEVAYQANQIPTAPANTAASEFELAQARRIIDSMERHGMNDAALKDLKNDVARQLAFKLPKRQMSPSESFQYRTADGRWRAQPLASQAAWEIQPLNERGDYAPALEPMLKSHNN